MQTPEVKFVCIAEYVSYIDDSCIVATMINLKIIFAGLQKAFESVEKHRQNYFAGTLI